VRLYYEVARTTARRLTTYRGATFAGIVTNTVFGFLLSYVLLAVFRQRPDVGGYDAVDAVTFTFVTQGLLMTVGVMGYDLEMSLRVKTGDVALDLSRPYDYQAWWAAAAYGRAAFYAVARGLPPFLAGALAFDLRLPDAAWVWPAFAAAVLLAVGVAFAWAFILQLSAFWILDMRGPVQLGMLAANFLSGTLLPLVFFPDSVEWLVRLLPFASMIQVPVEVFLGKVGGVELAVAYAAQVAWLVALLAVGRLILSRAERRVVVQGG
jgi:ABC-2 type transport system permease protein